jgi:oligopeptide transport system ATP-binding protein
MTTPVLEVRDLSVTFDTRDGVVHAVNGNSFVLKEGQCLAVLGESGSGKSVTAQAIMGILPAGYANVTEGSITYRGVDLLSLSEVERTKVRGHQIAMIFQDSLSALNPVYKVGKQITEVYARQKGVSRADARKKALELMDLVRIPDAANRINSFPFQFSGGMRQRIMIAMSLALDPDVLIADEPTTALDVTVQAEIMALLQDIRTERNMSMILITHDMGVVAENADDVVVMYAGRCIERGTVAGVYASPRHPYTVGLLRAVPKLEPPTGAQFYIPGAPPTLFTRPDGCPFHPRCPRRQDVCTTVVPPEAELEDGHRTACHNPFPGVSND